MTIVAAALAIGGGGDDGRGRAGSEKARASAPSKPPELPRGGREIFPKHRVVGFYGAPQAEELGALGIGTPTRAARRLRAQAREYRRGGRPVLPAFELLATIASGAPGPGEKYRNRQDKTVIRRYLKAARRARALLILDIQPGRADFMTEVRALREFLEEPDVSLALDPEWSMDPGQIPGQVIGDTDAATVNRVSRYLAGIVRRKNLPQKLLLVHQFTNDMIKDKASLAQRRGIALTISIDGFGDRPNKIAKYREFTSERVRFHNGFKLFYREDTNLMTPRRVLRLRPQPEIVVYE